MGFVPKAHQESIVHVSIYFRFECFVLLSLLSIWLISERISALYSARGKLQKAVGMRPSELHHQRTFGPPSPSEEASTRVVQMLEFLQTKHHLSRTDAGRKVPVHHLQGCTNVSSPSLPAFCLQLGHRKTFLAGHLL